MLLLLLRNGSHVELPKGHDVIHKLTVLFCLDELGQPLLTVPSREVLGYTKNVNVAETILSTAKVEEEQVQGDTDGTVQPDNSLRVGTLLEFV
jgi:hypothetical protein